MSCETARNKCGYTQNVGAGTESTAEAQCLRTMHAMLPDRTSWLVQAAVASHYSATQIKGKRPPHGRPLPGREDFRQCTPQNNPPPPQTPQHHQAAQNHRDAHTAGELPHATSYPSITTQVQPKIRDTSGGLSLPSIFQAPYPPHETHCASDTAVFRTRRCTTEPRTSNAPDNGHRSASLHLSRKRAPEESTCASRLENRI